MQVPFLDLRQQYQPLAAQIEDRVLRVLRSGQYVLGPEVEEFEHRAAEYLGVKEAVAVSSGTDALLMALMALGIGPGDEVLVPDFSFIATAMVILRVGATPILVDVDPATLTIDPARAAQKVTGRTRAIIPVHLYGQMADMEAILEMAQAAKLWVIEDAAQAFGAEDARGRKAGTLGTVGCFSFYPTKNLGSAGEAGLIVTNDPDLAQRLRIIRNQGQQRRYESVTLGGNFRMDALQAAVLNVKLSYLDGWNQERQRLAAHYRALLERANLLRSTNAPLRLPVVRHQHSNATFPHIYHQFIIFAKDRDQLQQFLRQYGIGTEVYYPLPFHRQPCFRQRALDPVSSFPVADAAAATVLALPIYPGLSSQAQEYVVEKIAAFYYG